MTVPALGAPPPPLPPPRRVSPGSTPRDVTTGWVEECTRLEATASTQDSGWERPCGGQRKERCWSVCAQAQGGASAQDVPVCVGRCVLLGGVGAWLSCSCWGAVPLPAPSANIHTCKGWRGEVGPSTRLPHFRGDFPGLADEAGVGSCKGGWQLLDLALLHCVTLSRRLLLAEPPSSPGKWG